MVTKVSAAMVAADVATQSELDASIAVKLTGDVIQRARFATGAVSTGTTVVQSVNPPAITEGNQVMALAFTPLSATSILRIRVVVHASCSAASPLGAASLHAGGAALAVGAIAAAAASDLRPIVIEYEMVAGTTSTVRFGGALSSYISIDEIKA